MPGMCQPTVFSNSLQRGQVSLTSFAVRVGCSWITTDQPKMSDRSDVLPPNLKVLN